MPTIEIMRDTFASGIGSNEEVEIVIASPYGQLADKQTRIRHLKLYQAALSGDWSMAEGIYKKHKNDIRARILKDGDTALHIAAAAEQTDFLKKLVDNINKEDLATTNYAGTTAFCLAAVSGNVEHAQVMMDKMKKEDLTTKKGAGKTAYCLSVESQKVELPNMIEESTNLADVLERSRNLAMIRGRNEMSPLYMAALFGHKEMVQFLYKATDDESLHDNDRIELLITLISNGLYVILLRNTVNSHQERYDLTKQMKEPFHNTSGLPEKHPELAVACDGNEETALLALAQTLIASQIQQGFWKQRVNLFSGANAKLPPKALELIRCLWEQIILSHDSAVSNIIKTARQLIFVAAELGNIEFLTILICEYPDLILEVDKNNYSIFHFAVVNHRKDILKLIHEIGTFKDLIVASKDKKDNNILHLAGMLAPPDRLNVVSGAALQLQRELLWFKEVSKIMHPLDAWDKNSEGKTPRALFTKEQGELKGKGEKWMKDTANYCMIVATLIATVVFAAAFTVPGGTKDETGTPHFVQKTSFKIFVFSDAVSLVSSACSILTFLSILTSRYAEEDFLSQLPKKLVAGLTTLLLSIAAMMVVFCATIFIVFKDGVLWVPILVTVITSIPVLLFTKQQWRLLFDVVRSTYVSSSLFQPHKRAKGKQWSQRRGSNSVY
ncbi:ankyrin repeat-containing protein At5g02620-like [Pistacia vera]|uniref:ankyrin repeat-containing protein At5g02620-like n=1 Tax=Pistacia vera TaxID=55513 RepID=UPI001263779B|nr:ankyrin repeat-containing protein At5g02620-like [Pistacia vera]